MPPSRLAPTHPSRSRTFKEAPNSAAVCGGFYLLNITMKTPALHRSHPVYFYFSALVSLLCGEKRGRDLKLKEDAYFSPSILSARSSPDLELLSLPERHFYAQIFAPFSVLHQTNQLVFHFLLLHPIRILTVLSESEHSRAALVYFKLFPDLNLHHSGY